MRSVQTSQNCPVILTNFYDKNAHFSIRAWGQRPNESFFGINVIHSYWYTRFIYTRYFEYSLINLNSSQALVTLFYLNGIGVCIWLTLGRGHVVRNTTIVSAVRENFVNFKS